MSTEPIDAVSDADEPEIPPKSMLAATFTSSEPTRETSDEDEAEVDQPRGDARGVHHFTHEDEERQRDERVGVHPREQSLRHHHEETRLENDEVRQCREPKGVGDGYSDREKHREREEQEGESHASTSSSSEVAPRSASPRSEPTIRSPQ